MKTPNTDAVMTALDGQAMFVGGCVRNVLMGGPETDIDLATPLCPEEVSAKLIAADIKAVPTGIDHGTVTAVADGQPFEITTLRKDVETDGRHAVVAYTGDWEEDSRRRDFTINTLLADREGNIFDPTGCGLADLDARRVRFVGDARTRIAEDYLRILRFFRFHAWYGSGEPDAEALAACAATASELVHLSKERITHEILKLLRAPAPSIVLEIMKKNKVLPELFHEKLEWSVLSRYESYNNASMAAMLLILSALDPAHMAVLETRMAFSKALKKDYEALAGAVQQFGAGEDRDVKKTVYFYGNEKARQVLQIKGIENAALLKLAENWSAPDFPVKGEDLIREGYSPGPELGKKLKEMETRWIESGFPAGIDLD